MGQISTTGKTEKIKYQEFVQNYQFIRKIRDPRYGEISILEDKQTKEQVALKEMVSKDNKDFEKEINFFTVRCRIIHQNILRLLGYTSKSEDKLCASFHKIFMIVEYLDNDLEKEIASKKSSNQYYSEQQLWYIAESTIKGLALLQKNAIVHGDIKPGNIFISRMGVYKIAEHNLIGNVMPGYNQRLFGFHDNRVYLSPAQMQSLKYEETRPKHNPWKSDVFSLGMTLVHASTLSNCDSMYDWSKFNIDAQAIEQRIMTMRGQYSEAFCNFVKSMLTISEEARPDLKKLEGTLFQPSAEPIFTVQQETKEQEDQLFINDELSFVDEVRDVPTQQVQQVQSRNFEVYEDAILDEQDWKAQEKKAGRVNVKAQNTSQLSVSQFSEKNGTQSYGKISGTQTPQPFGQASNVRLPLQSASNANSMVFSDKILNEDEVCFNPGPTELKESRVLQSSNPFLGVQQFGYVETISKSSSESGQNPLRPISNNDLKSSTHSRTSQTQEYQKIADDLDYIKQLVAKSLKTDMTLKDNTKNENMPKQTFTADEKQFSKPEFGVSSLPMRQDITVNRVTTEYRRDEKENMTQPHVILGSYNPNFYKQQQQPSQSQTFETTNLPDCAMTSSYSLKESGANFNPLISTNQVIATNSAKPLSSDYNPQKNSNASFKKNPEQPIQQVPQTLEERILTRAYSGSSYTESQTKSFAMPITTPVVNNTPVTFNEDRQLKSQPTADFGSNLGFQNDILAYLPADLRAQLTQLKGYSNPYLQQGYSGYQAYNLTSNKIDVSEIKANESEQISFSSDHHNQTGFSSQFGGEKYVPVDQNFSKLSNDSRVSAQPRESEFKAPSVEGIPSYLQSELPRESEMKKSNTQQFSYLGNSSLSQNETFTSKPVLPVETKETYSDGSIYIGEKKNGLRHGKGKFYYSDGGMYEGDWVNGSMDGYGILSYGGGAVAYKGYWMQDKFHGQGILFNQEAETLYGGFDYSNFDNLGDYWTKYEGEFDNDHKSGSGAIYLSNGDRYEGQFKEDLIHGIGSFITSTGRELKGEWWRNKLVKQFN